MFNTHAFFFLLKLLFIYSLSNLCKQSCDCGGLTELSVNDIIGDLESSSKASKRLILGGRIGILGKS